MSFGIFQGYPRPALGTRNVPGIFQVDLEYSRDIPLGNFGIFCEYSRWQNTLGISQALGIFWGSISLEYLR